MALSLEEEIRLQSKNLSNILDHLASSQKTNLEAIGASLQNERPIVLIGMASAEYLCYPAQYYFAERGRMCSVMNAADALYSLLPSLKNANVVINSRSGETVEIVRLGKALVQAGIPFTTITNAPESSLARLAERILWVNSYQDQLVSINIISSMMTATLAVAAEACGDSQSLWEDLGRLPAAMEASVAMAWDSVERLASFFEKVRPIYLLYRGATKGTAYCARLVLEEVARFPGIAMEAGEFRQGPMEVIDGEFGAMIFSSTAEQMALNIDLAKSIQSSGGRVMALTPTAEQASTQQAWFYPLP